MICDFEYDMAIHNVKAPSRNLTKSSIYREHHVMNH